MSFSRFFQQPRLRTAKVTGGKIIVIRFFLLLAEAGAHLRKVQLVEVVIRS